MSRFPATVFWPSILALVPWTVAALEPVDAGALETGDGPAVVVEEDDVTEIVVTAERGPEDAREVAASLASIDGDAIARRGPADAAAILGQAPGVDAQSMSPGGFGGNVSIRGSSDFKPGGFGNRVLVLLDGFPLNTPDADGVDWSSLPLFDLGRIEVLRGPASALYGSAAVGGVIQFLSNPPAPESDLALGQGFAGTDGNRARLQALWSQGTAGGGLRMAGQWQRYLGLRPGGEDEFRHNSQSETFGLRARGSIEPAPGHRLLATAFAGGGSGGNPGFEGTSERSRSRVFRRVQSQLGTRWEYRPAAGLSAEAGAYWNASSQTVSDPGGANPNQYRCHRVGLRGQLSLPLFGRSLHTGGLELQFDRVGGTVFQLGQADADRAYLALVGAAFWQAQVDLGSGVEASAGLRLDGHAFDTRQRFFSISPKARLAYRPAKDAVLWAALNRGFRVPTIGEMYLSYATTYGLTFQGNPKLSPESVWAAEIGARRAFLDGRLSAELVCFANLGSDTIEFVYSSPVSAQNLARSRILGAELSLRARPARWLDLSAALSTLDAVALPGAKPLLYRPAAKASFEARALWRDFEISAFVAAMGSRYYDDFLDSGAATLDPETGLLRFPRRTLGAYATVDLRASWHQRPMALSIVASNLLDARVYAIQGYPAPGREVFLEAAFAGM